MRNLRKQVLTVSVLLFTAFSLLGQWTYLGLEQEAVSSIEFEQNGSDIILTQKLSAYSLEEVSINGDTYFVPVIPDGVPMLEAKAPEVQKLHASLRIGNEVQYSYELVSSASIEIQSVKIAPSKGNLTRDINPSSLPFEFGKVYQTDFNFPGNLVSLSNPYIIRELRGLAVHFYPIQYNPVSETLTIYTEIKVRLIQANENPVNPLLGNKTMNKQTHDFEAIYSRHFINYPDSKYTQVSEEGDMLIICHPDFWEVMQPFVSWKIQKGMKTTMVDVTQIGNQVAIKNYVQDFYDENNLSYLLLVGDAQFVPTITLTSGHSDNAYGYLAGNDSYPEVFVGRFSAESVADAQTMVQRVIDYELNPVVANHFEHVQGIASQEGPGDDGEYDFEHIRIMQDKMLLYHYTSASEFFEGSQGGLDAAGHPTAAMVGNQINTGVGAILYTGHGSNTTFSTSGFSNANVNNLTNTGKLPFIWSVACVNGNFVGNTCFGEAWTRARINSEPIGAIATLMSTINQSWNPPMAGQDEMVDILVESFANNIKRSFGGISMHGCMHMNDAYGNQGYPMTDTWTCFGDPSVMVRTATPLSMTANHPAVAFIGTSTFAVNVNVDGALVAITQGNEILGTALVQNGIAMVSFPALNSVGTFTVTITAYNYVPYVGNVDVVPNQGPYVTLQSFAVNNGIGTPANHANYNQTVQLDITLENVGIEMAYQVTGTLNTTDPYITINSTTYNYGDIDSTQTLAINGIYEIQVADNVPDQHVAAFELVLEDNAANTWISYLSLPINAPKLSISFVSLIELVATQVNARMDAGETIEFEFIISNDGQAGTGITDVNMSCVSPFISLIDSSASYSQIDAANFTNCSFTFHISPMAPSGLLVDFLVSASSGAYTDELSLSREIGLIVEDWETNSFESFDWIIDPNYPWITVQNQVFEGSNAARSASIPHNQSSTLELVVDVLVSDSISFYKKVSCEPAGWYYYDYLEFFIDNVSMGQWAGEIDWSREVFPISAGAHTLKWVYKKDGYYVEGQDCAWVDFIKFPALDINYAPFFLTQIDTIHHPATQLFELDIEAYDINTADVLSFTAVSLPEFLSLTDNGDRTAQLTGTPALGHLGSHNIRLKVSDGVIDSPEMEFVLRVYDLVNAEEWQNKLLMQVYPNPANQTLMIELSGTDGKGIIEMINLDGKVQKTVVLNQTNTVEMDISNLPAGVYIIKWQAGQVSIIERLIKL